MSIISYSFFLFLLITLIVYYVVPKKMQWMVLLVSSIVFYAYAGWVSLAIIVGTALFVYLLSLAMQKNLEKQDELTASEDRKGAIKIKNRMRLERKKYVVLGLVLIIFLMVLFKGSDFIIENINLALQSFDVSSISSFNLIVPFGISYYSFMMISYLMELYTGKTRAQKNFLKYLTYVLYFPHITQGPIARFEETGNKVIEPHDFDFYRLSDGVLLILWGYFKKLVVADRMAPFVNDVLGNSDKYKGSVFLAMGIAYSMQIYCDFSGCMDVVRGVSECFGISLRENFRRPYFSKTMPEFWRRWHISLGEFFREYVFYPVSTSKLALKLSNVTRKWFGNDWGRNISSALPILCVWVLTGVWHGANWNYIGWGVYHGILICLSTLFSPFFAKVAKKHVVFSRFGWKVVQMARTFFLCLIGRIIFLGKGLSNSFYMLKSSFADISTIEWEAIKALNIRGWLVVICGCLLVIVVSIVQEHKQSKDSEYMVRSYVMKKNVFVRVAVTFIAVMAILCLGKYGAGVGTTFIYEQF